jgi:hypothetical protein
MRSRSGGTLRGVRDSPSAPTGSGRRSWAAILLGAATALSASSAVLILTQHPLAAGLAAVGAAVGVVGGPVLAHAAGGGRVRLAGSLVERTFDACVLGSLAWVARSGTPRVSALALAGLAASFTASYERAKAVSLAYTAPEGAGYEMVRMSLPAAGLVTGWIEAFLWAHAALSLTALGVRAWSVAIQHREGPAPRLRPSGAADGG